MPPPRSTTDSRIPGWERMLPVALVLALLGLVVLRLSGTHMGPWGPMGHDGTGHGPPVGPGMMGDTTPDPLAAVLVVTAALALVLSRHRPRTTLAVTAGATAVWFAIGYPYGPILLCLAVAVYGPARFRPTREATLWAAAVVLLLLAARALGAGGDAALLALVPLAAWVALPVTIGLARRLTAETRTRDRRAADERLVQAERLRVAQEVHDVVGHGLAAIQMQADIALHVRDARPEQPEEALRAISAASAEALEELRSTLTALDGGTGGTDESRAPTVGVARLPSLAERVTAAGVHVDLTVDSVDGTDAADVDATLPPTVDLAVYRIVQESLTNVVKHSAHPRAEVRVTRTRDHVEVEVTNEDLAAQAPDEGFGIAGMRRRAEHLGGELAAGPGPEPGTFRVHARLPLPQEQP